MSTISRTQKLLNFLRQKCGLTDVDLTGIEDLDTFDAPPAASEAHRQKRQATADQAFALADDLGYVSKELSATAMLSENIAIAVLKVTKPLAGPELGPLTLGLFVLKDLLSLYKAARKTYQSTQKRVGKIAMIGISLGLLVAGTVLLAVAPVIVPILFFAYSAYHTALSFKRLFQSIRNRFSKKALVAHHEEKIKECNRLEAQIQEKMRLIEKQEEKLKPYQERLEQIAKKIEATKNHQALARFKKFEVFEGLSLERCEKLQETLTKHRETLTAELKEVRAQRTELMTEKAQTEKLIQAQSAYQQAKATYAKETGRSSLKENSYLHAQEELDKAEEASESLKQKLNARVAASAFNSVASAITSAGFAIVAFVPVVGLLIGSCVALGGAVMGFIGRGIQALYQRYQRSKQAEAKTLEERMTELKKTLTSSCTESLTEHQKNVLLHDALKNPEAQLSEKETLDSATKAKMIRILEARIKADLAPRELVRKLLQADPKFAFANEAQLQSMIQEKMLDPRLSRKDRLLLYKARDLLKARPFQAHVAQLNAMLKLGISPDLREKIQQQMAGIEKRMHHVSPSARDRAAHEQDAAEVFQSGDHSVLAGEEEEGEAAQSARALSPSPRKVEPQAQVQFQAEKPISNLEMADVFHP